MFYFLFSCFAAVRIDDGDDDGGDDVKIPSANTTGDKESEREQETAIIIIIIIHRPHRCGCSVGGGGLTILNHVQTKMVDTRTHVDGRTDDSIYWTHTFNSECSQFQYCLAIERNFAIIEL